MEIMESALIPIIDDLQGQYTEEFCKYNLYKLLKALTHLHRLNIIHRDIKSDEILIKADGEI